MRFKRQRSNDPKQPYYFEIQAAGNYESLATSETYVSKADAQHAIDLIKGGGRRRHRRRRHVIINCVTLRSP